MEILQGLLEKLLKKNIENIDKRGINTTEKKRTANPQIVNEIVKAIRETKNIYFKGKHLLSNILAGDIVFDKFDPTDNTGINRGFIVLDNKEIMVYYDGAYHEEGKETIEAVARIMMHEKAKNQNVTEVVTAVKQFPSLYVKIKDIETKYKDYISLKNGILNIITGEMIPHDMDYILIEQMDLKFNKDAKCPMFMKYINEILAQDDVKVIQELFGYILLKSYKYPNFFLFIGNGRNGKTTLLNLIKAFIGNKSMMSLSLHELTTSQFSIAQLFGKLANISGDIGASVIEDTSLLKLLTGNDEITARRFHQDFITFTNHAKLIFAANNPPEFPNDKSDAFATRLTFLEFNAFFPQGDPKTDDNLIEKLKTEEELSGILNWALEGLHRLLKNKKFSYNKSTADNLRLYEERANPILGFCNSILKVELGSYLQKAEVLYKYNEWCVAHQKPVINEVHFSRKLFQTMYGVQSSRITLGAEGERVWVYKNLTWKDSSIESNKIDIEKPSSPQQKLNISLDDKINSLKIFLENNPSKYEDILKEGFEEILIKKCTEQNIISKRPDGRYEVNG